MMDRIVISRDILPIFIFNEKDTANPVAFQGSGFLVAPQLLVTCWHCVNARLESGAKYGVAIKDDAGDYRAVFLDNVEQDYNGNDLATANVDLKPSLALRLARKDVPYGTYVFTFGYPLTRERKFGNGNIEFELEGRYLEGYVMRAFHFDYPGYGRTNSYELSIPTFPGLSGAPVIRVGSTEVIGVVYYSHEVATVDQYVSIDPTTGKRQPEVQRIIDFGLAHFTDTLQKLRGKATNGLPLADHLSTGV